MRATTATLLLFLAAMSANAQPVYRCGSTYTTQPCPQGKLVEATDPRTAAQRAEARRVSADERRLAAEMKRDRLADEAAIRPAGASSLSGPSAASSAPDKTRKTRQRSAKKLAAGEDFVAREPRLAKASGKR